MALYRQLFSFNTLTLAAAAEAFFVLKFLPELSHSYNHLGIFGAVFLCNYTIWAVFWLFVYRWFLDPLRHVPGPRAVFSVIHRNLLERKRAPGSLFLDLEDEYPDDDMLAISAFESQVVIMKPKLLSDFLVHRAYDFVKPTRISTFLRYVLGDGLIIIEGDRHKFLRKNSMPAFSFRHIKDLYPMIWGKTTAFITAVTSEVEGNGIEEPKAELGVLEINSWASRVTLDIIGIAGLGRKFNMLQKSEDPLLEIYEELLEPSGEKLAFALASITFGYKFIRYIPWKMNNLFNYLTTTLTDICQTLIQDKRRVIEEKADDHFDILSLLIKSNNFSDRELTDQLLTFLAAGHETTSSALTWASYLLAKHPDLQVKLRREVQEALPKDLSAVDTNDLANVLESLPYLNGVINETFRLYPTVPLTMRQAIRDTRLGQQIIPKDTVVIMSMWQINRSRSVWGPNAAEFTPERWITDAGKPNQTGGASSNYDLTTFLHGPRSCIGQGFARAEMRCLLAALAASFTWDLAMDEAKILPRGVITIKPANGLYLRLKPLEKEV